MRPFARDPLRSYFYEPQKNEIYCLNNSHLVLKVEKKEENNNNKKKNKKKQKKKQTH